ncbi:unnamed protein product [Cladocopium goreaui]|uniref:COP9 signalosome complex subunit 8 n=1 Tax=Cladocopium goreaui TaxID=2562237 RepID=A0A9P1CHI9_9DINO|nr:unnamed protein product [Cladocopium goreaui]
MASLNLDEHTLRMLVWEHCCASEEQSLQLLQLRSVSRWWRQQFDLRRIQPLYGFALPAVAHVAMHWGMFTEHGVISTQSWHRDSEVVWITDPDEDHGDFEGYSEGSKISPWQAYQLWHALLQRVCAWHSSQGKPQPFGQGLEVCRLQLGPRGRRRDIEVFQPYAERSFLFMRMSPAERQAAMQKFFPPFKDLCSKFIRCGEKVKGTAADGARLSRLCPFEGACPVQPLHLFGPRDAQKDDLTSTHSAESGGPMEGEDVDCLKTNSDSHAGIANGSKLNCWQM